MNPNTTILSVIAGLLLYTFLTQKTWATPGSGQEYEAHFKGAENMYNLPAGLLSRMAYQESRYNPNAISAAGAIGIMQIIPKWHPGINPYNPKESIYYAGAIMRQYYNEFKTLSKALAAYNWGETNVRNKGISHIPVETQNYIKNILGDIGA